MDKYMRMAINEAKKGITLGEGGPFGCVIVKDGKVVSKAHNQVLKNNDATCHGEVNAIRKAGKKLGSFNLKGCELYTTGEPCPMCLSAILWANVDKVYYGCTIADNDKIGFRDKVFADSFGIDYSTLPLPMLEVDRDACLKLFEEYNAIKGKKHY